MKKIVLLSTICLLFGTYANAADNLSGNLPVANMTEAVAATNEGAGEGDLSRKKFKILEAIKENSMKIRMAQRNNEPTAELEEQNEKLIDQLNELDDKIMESGAGEEMKKARESVRERSAEEVSLNRQRYDVNLDISILDKEIAAAQQENKPTADLEAKKDLLLKKLKEIDSKISAMAPED